MLEGLRAEFPGATGWIARLRRPAVARESIGWAFLSAAGAGFIVGGIVSLLLAVLWPALFPPTEPHPSWLNVAAISRSAGALAIGAVALRSGGFGALGLYVLYELALTVAAFPSREYTCRQIGGGVGQGPEFRFSCDLLGLVVDRWPTGLTLAIGAAASRWVLRSEGRGANRLLRGAGVFAVVVAITLTALGVLTILTIPLRTAEFNLIFTCVYLVTEVIAGVLAGLVLWRAPLAASVLLVVLILASLASTFPLALTNGMPNEPYEVTFIRWAGAIAPMLGAASILIVRLLARRSRGSGTIS
jgi:hypothetical protein